MNDLFEQFRQSEKVPIIPPVEAEPSPEITEILIVTADCPARVYRIVQPTLFDHRPVYQ